jgi:DNA-binding MarR family transcriptional regulator
MSRRDDLSRVDRALTRIAKISLGRQSARYRSERAGVFLSRPAISILACLRVHGPMRLSDLARHSDLEPPLVSREVRALVDDGYVRRSAHPTDGRVGIVELTALGRETSETYRAAADAITAEVFAAWSADDIKHLAAQLERVADEFSRPVGG